MRKYWFLLVIVFAVLFCTVRIPAQTTNGTSQVSPVANLQGSNSSVVNNNFQMMQNGINGALYLIQSYFPGGILQTKNGGTGANLSSVASGDTLVMSPTETITTVATGPTGDVLTSAGPNNPPAYSILPSTPHTLIGTWQDNIGAVYTNSGSEVDHYTVIDTGTDWASKSITIIAATDVNFTDSFDGTSPNIVNTSATVLSNMSFHSTDPYTRFIIQTVGLPSSTGYVTLFSYTSDAQTQSIAIGINSSGNLCLVSVANQGGVVGGGNYNIYTQLVGTILRTP